MAKSECVVQTRKVFKEQLRTLPTSFPHLVHLDLSGYAWLTDSELLGLKVSDIWPYSTAGAEDTPIL